MNNSFIYMAITLTTFKSRRCMKEIHSEKFYYYMDRRNRKNHYQYTDSLPSINCQNIYNYINNNIQKKKFNSITELINVLSYNLDLYITDDYVLPNITKNCSHPCIQLELYSFLDTKEINFKESRIISDNIFHLQNKVDTEFLDIYLYSVNRKPYIKKVLMILNDIKIRKIANHISLKVYPFCILIKYINPFNKNKVLLRFGDKSYLKDIQFYITENISINKPCGSKIYGSINNVSDAVNIISLISKY